MLHVVIIAFIVVLGAITGVALSHPIRPTLIRDRYELVSCRPQQSVCLIFDSAEGQLLFIPLPVIKPNVGPKGSL